MQALQVLVGTQVACRLSLSHSSSPGQETSTVLCQFGELGNIGIQPELTATYGVVG